ncbi:MAG: hypothetical protein ACI91J_001763 [Yoonia sp.]
MDRMAELEVQRNSPNQMDHLHGAFVYSVLFHLLLMLAWELNRHYDLVSALRIVETLDPTRLVIKAKKEKPKEMYIPIEFVQVDPATMSADDPKDAKAYSSISSVAASDKPSPTKSEQPKLDGKNRNSALLKDVARASKGAPPPSRPTPPAKKAKKASKAPAKQPPKKEEQPDRPGPKRPPKPSEFDPLPKAPLMAKAIPVEKMKPKPQPLLPLPARQVVSEPNRTVAKAAPITPPKTRPRPKSLAEARQRRSQTQLIVGESMRRDGGTKRVGRAALNVAGTSFGAYDQMIVAVIQSKWHLLMGTRPTSRGTVRLKFKHWSNGRVTDMETLSTTVDDFQTTICQMSIQNSAPFRPWPIDLRRLHEQDFREVTFSFTY